MTSMIFWRNLFFSIHADYAKFLKKKVIRSFTCILDSSEKTMLLHDPDRGVCRFFAHADYMDTTQNEKRLVINGLFFSVTVGLVMIYMVSFHGRFFNYAVITMRFIAPTIDFYHAIFGFWCDGCTLF